MPWPFLLWPMSCIFSALLVTNAANLNGCQSYEQLDLSLTPTLMVN